MKKESIKQIGLCLGCNTIRPVEFFETVSTVTGEKGRTDLCKVCLESGLTQRVAKKRRVKKICSVCNKEKQVAGFMGNKFAGDPYDNKTSVCAQCREEFLLLERSFNLLPLGTCPMCKEQKEYKDFNESLTDEVKYIKGFISISPHKICNRCRCTEKFMHFIKYLKRVKIKTSKKICMDKK